MANNSAGAALALGPVTSLRCSIAPAASSAAHATYRAGSVSSDAVMDVCDTGSSNVLKMAVVETVPEWVVDSLQVFEQPSAVLRAVAHKLDLATFQKVLLLAPSLQVRLVGAVLLCPDFWRDPDGSVRRMLQLLQNRGGSVPPAVLQDCSDRKQLKVVLVLNCVGIGTGHLVVHAALRVLQQRLPDVKILVLGAYSFEVHPDALAVETRVIGDMGLQVEQLGDVTFLPDFLRQRTDEWKQGGLWPLMLNSWPCKNTSKAAPMPNRPAGSGLHMQHSRVMWPIAAAHMQLARDFGPAGFGHLTEYPKCGNQGEEDVVDRFFGKAFESNPRVYQAANRPRRIRTSPCALSVQQHHQIIEPRGPIDGWVWLGNGAGEAATYPLVTLRSHLVRLAEQQLFGDSKLQDFELIALKRLRMRHETTGEERLIARRFWFHWLGVALSPIEKTMASLWPCLQCIHATTGMAADASLGGEACGHNRWCQNCETCFELLGQGWHLATMADCLVALFEQVAADRFDKVPAQWFLPPDEAQHECGPSCALNPRPGL